MPENHTPELLAIGERLRTQDNRITQNPMFCVQIKRRDVGYDPSYADNTVWINMESGDYEEVPEDTKGAEEFGYKDRWETVMAAFTEGGCERYLELNGHNDRSRAHNGEVRIYVESFNRCPEMIAIREALMTDPAKLQAAEDRAKGLEELCEHLAGLLKATNDYAEYHPNFTPEMHHGNELAITRAESLTKKG